MNLYTRFLFSAFLISLTSLCNGQAKFTATIDAKEILADSYVTVSFTLENAQGKSFSPPDFNGFTKLSGPSQSTRSTNYNGKRSFSQTFSYVLRPLKTGRLQIGAASITANNKKLKTNPLSLNVVKAIKKNKRSGIDYYVTMELSDSIAYPGQQIILDYQLYYASDKSVRSIDVRQEDEFDGFFASVINDNNNVAERRIVNGNEYVVQSVRKVALFPQTQGEFEIKGANFVLFLPQKQQRGFFFNSFKEEHLISNGASVSVKSLPKPIDPYFCGAVGKYHCIGYLNKTSISTDQAITLNLKVIGDGDPKLVSPPQLRLVKELEVYDPNLIKEEQFIDQGKQKHQKIYEYLIVPSKKGRYNITPSITYYDPDSSAYIESKSTSFRLNVVPGSGNTLNEETTLAQRSDKLVPFKKNISTSPNNYNFFGSTTFWSLTSILFLAFPFLSYKKHKQVQLQNIDPIALKYQEARKVAIKRLESAQRFMQENNQRSFFDEVAHAIYGYVSDKLHILPADLSRNNISEKLNSLQVEDNAIKQLEEILLACELALFAGTNESGKMHSIYTSTIDLISNIENQVD